MSGQICSISSTSISYDFDSASLAIRADTPTLSPPVTNFNNAHLCDSGIWSSSPSK